VPHLVRCHSKQSQSIIQVVPTWSSLFLTDFSSSHSPYRWHQSLNDSLCTTRTACKWEVVPPGMITGSVFRSEVKVVTFSVKDPWKNLKSTFPLSFRRAPGLMSQTSLNHPFSSHFNTTQNVAFLKILSLQSNKWCWFLLHDNYHPIKISVVTAVHLFQYFRFYCTFAILTISHFSNLTWNELSGYQ
jgi:hypothetical protein